MKKQTNEKTDFKREKNDTLIQIYIYKNSFKCLNEFANRPMIAFSWNVTRKIKDKGF